MPEAPGLCFRHVEVDGRLVDVRIAGERVTGVGPGLGPAGGAAVIDGHGGALVPGLHDHHIHLLATAAARRSVPVGPRDVRDRVGLAAALRAADAALPPGRWIRAVGYHESVGGDLDRRGVDALVPGRPVRIQHRSGARWILNSAAVEALGLDGGDRPDHAGIERDGAGRATGRLHRSDAWLRTLLPGEGPPDLAPLGRLLTRFGVTGVTDTTPYTRLADLAPLSAAVRSGALPQRVVVTGGPGLAGSAPPDGLEWGPVKIVIDDGDYPRLDELCDGIRAAHGSGRPVAIHCVTRTALVLALAAWDDAGSRTGDRVEHGAVIAPDLYPALRHHRLTVVTQPGFVGERGDEYARDVDAGDRAHLYPCRSLAEAGVAVAGSTDAPYSNPDPWRAIAAASTRRTPSGAVLGAGEAVSARRALGLFLADPHAPGGAARTVSPGAVADLCLLPAGLDEVLAGPAPARAVSTTRRGRVVGP
ncbi:MAG TPA: amidohydrolase family protein [Acidimicrobiales bacterium]|nr:amidohydrolase family protein [Acidimicrobiales bacterium]